MEEKKSNFVIKLLVAIIILLIGSWIVIYSPIYIGRTYTNFSETHSIDAVKVRLTWTVKYKAPLIIPKELLQDIEDKIDLYVGFRVYSFINREKATVLLNLSKTNELQKAFDEENIVDAILQLSPDLKKELDNIKSVKINSISFEKLFEEYIRKQEKAKHDADSLHNIIIALRSDIDLTRLVGDMKASQKLLEATIKEDVLNSNSNSGSVEGINWEILK
jgi:hypothetical protein